ncbi:AAA family ATPase [Synechococcales cyanobacterium C]|uniref:gluconokinase n=1 Tax=Petrachloros mirabilis ULC683 TaxID=2781853 RepID=A0A8K2A9F5_9CYAN|nr:bifunctional aminoglycoside phosphotransferase/ATP-binding protein [Petrachloros mirabilis]NCJ07985.1 AAA family ATPase [Petrachloros mirabilis ULC683]
MDPALPALIQQMLQADFYPHAVSEPVQLLQTHISYVLLTGEYAYKIKKPANFGFLDFSTLTQRHHFCEEEVRLNQRLSPSLYVGVVPLYQYTAEGYGWQGIGEPVEYAVQMRQFDQSQLLSRLFERGELTPELMSGLGRQVASFHETAATDADIQAFGDRAAIQQVDENNYALSEGFLGHSQTQERLEQTRTFTRQFFANHGDWFAQRQAEGKIRECHGDLHLNNVCRYQDKIQVFDCIEFNREFRNIDVIYDVAFMVMDLEFQGRPDLANAFLNAYLERTGDYWGAALLPLYLSMRAYIRGNVNSLALNDSAISDSEKQGFLGRAQAYYQAAWQYTQRPPGRLWIMCGLSGSGKSTVARAVASGLRALHIRSDAVRKHLAGIPLEQRGADPNVFGGGIYTPEMTQKTYDRLLDLGLFLAQQGESVVLDAKYDRQALRQAVYAKAESAQIPVQIVFCTAPARVLEERLRSRQGDIADATEALLAQQQAQFEPLSAAEQAHSLVCCTDQDLDPQLASLLAHPQP